MKKLLLILVLFFIYVGLFAETNPLWMRYPSISPDGKHIAFSYKDDIYKVSTKGGLAVQLTSHKAYDFKPVWSPDSKNIAYASDRFGNFDIFIISAIGGESRRLTYSSTGQTPNCFSEDGKYVYFTATMDDHYKNIQFPSGILSELYKVSIFGGRVKQILTTPAEESKLDSTGNYIIYQDRKGYENVWRKHHTSSVTKDIWIYNKKTKKHKKLTSFVGEDRNPVFTDDEKGIFYLSEKEGSFNVFSLSLNEPLKITQHTFHKKHPVRFLSKAANTLCYGYNGEIYLKKNKNKPIKVKIEIRTDSKRNAITYKKLSSGATEMAVSPDGKEVAFIIRGEVFVTAVNYSTTKRITNTPEQERSVSFSPDGRSLLYAAERDGSWNLYKTDLHKDDLNFTNSIILKENPVLVSDKETFQPQFSPDGKEVAFLEERTILKVINLKSKKTRTILPAKYNYSYADGDQWYQWSPDNKWFLVQFLSKGRWSYECGLISSKGDQELVNLTKSGFEDYIPKWSQDGKMMLWYSNKYGMGDIFGMFFTKDSFDKFRLSKEEYELLKEREKRNKKNLDKKKKDKKGTKKTKEDKEKKEEKPKLLKIDLNNIENRIIRLTINSSNLSDGIMSKKGDKLYYLSRFEKGHDLWVHDFRKKSTKLLVKLGGRGGSLALSKDGKELFVFSRGKFTKITLAGNKRKSISYSADFNLNSPAERVYLLEHVWRQIKKKFYDPKLHGVDWSFYKKEYLKFLPYINNNYDFAEMLSEMLGELNGSHTGSGYRAFSNTGDNTAKLGVFYDLEFKGDGLKIIEIINKGPLQRSGSKIMKGTIIEKIDNYKITKSTNYYKLLNRKANKNILLSLYNPKTKKRWEEIRKPISRGANNQLLYERWIKTRKEETDRLSKGRLGYIHVRSMSGGSYRETFAELFGKFTNKEAIIIDTRFNGGGNLVEQLTTLLSGEKYLTNIPRGQNIGIKPENRWTKKSIVLISESNYSDAHGFPYGYKTLGLGKLVGMPVPGTMTSVWWETLQDRTLYFGIPQVGKYDLNGKYLENQQLEPDYLINNEYEKVVKGIDQQLEKAVEVLLEELDKK